MIALALRATRIQFEVKCSVQQLLDALDVSASILWATDIQGRLAGWNVMEARLANLATRRAIYPAGSHKVASKP